MENVPTCQESRIECIKPLKFQIIEVHDALITLSENSLDVSIKHESLTLSEQICDLSFLTLLITWYDILKYINIVSKTMQSKSMALGTVIPLLKSYTAFLTDLFFASFAFVWYSRGSTRVKCHEFKYFFKYIIFFKASATKMGCVFFLLTAGLWGR